MIRAITPGSDVGTWNVMVDDLPEYVVVTEWTPEMHAWWSIAYPDSAIAGYAERGHYITVDVLHDSVRATVYNARTGSMVDRAVALTEPAARARAAALIPYT
jgi:hypothetical protein